MESKGRWVFEEQELLACCGSTHFAKQMSALSPFSNLQHAIQLARDIWFNKVNVNGWLDAFAAHPQIGQSPSSSSSHASQTFAQWSKGEQSTAMSTATSTTLQELTEWNAQYKQKFGFVFLICASGRSTAEILAELKRRYSNRPVVELKIAAEEQMKITELRLAKLFSTKSSTLGATEYQPVPVAGKANDRLSILVGHISSPSGSSGEKKSQGPKRTKPPITTHVLDLARGQPGAGVDVQLEVWQGSDRLEFPGSDPNGWTILGSGKTDSDGRSNPLMEIVDEVSPGFYRISFNTGKYYPSGFFPFVSIVFQITESQKLEQFHVPLLLAPFGFSTYRGS